MHIFWLGVQYPHNEQDEQPNSSYSILFINNLCNSTIQSEDIIFILRKWQRKSLSEHDFS